MTRKAMMAFSLPKLAYSYEALEPHVDAKTMEIHHTKHHQGYVDKLNAALEGTDWLDRSVEEVLKNLEALSDSKRTAVQNNGGGHANHSLFWKVMNPEGGGEPTGDLAGAMRKSFGEFGEFREKFTEAALSRFGSGWAWLVKDNQGALMIMSTPNQDSPYMEGLTPLLGLDVWEHAYYLNYQNRRADYVEAWWKVIDWEQVGKNFEAA